MSFTEFESEMDKYTSALYNQTLHALEGMEHNIQRLGPMQSDFKIEFLKNANYQLMSAYKRFEMSMIMKSKQNNDFNSAGARRLAQRNDHLNTPMVLHGGAISRMPPPNSTPFKQNVDSFGQEANFESFDASTNAVGVNGTSAVDREIFRAKDANVRSFSFANSNKQPDWSRNFTTNAPVSNCSPNHMGRNNGMNGMNDNQRNEEFVTDNGIPKIDASNPSSHSQVHANRYAVDHEFYPVFDDDKPDDFQHDPKSSNVTLKSVTTVNQQPENFFKNAFMALKNADIATNGNNHVKEIDAVRADSAQSYWKMNPKKASKRELMCFYCKEAQSQNNRFSAVDEVYDHWKSTHSHENIALGGAEQQPFRFYVKDLLYCNATDSCYYFSGLQGLQKHHMANHSSISFVPILNGRCAMCLYTGDDLNKHECDSLQNGLRLNLHNPIVLTDQDLADLLAIQCKNKRTQRAECEYCGGIFTTLQKMNEHHRQYHGDRMIKYKSANSDAKLVVMLICDCCQCEIPSNTYVKHLKSKEQFRWNQGPKHGADIWFQRFERQILRTKLVFSNGLVLFRQNLMYTDFGNYKGFVNLAEQIFKSLQNDI